MFADRLDRGDKMTTVGEHYDRHLAPVYVWMAGGFDNAIARGEADIDAIPCDPGDGRQAVDLGAGFGMHAIPLARRGYSVLAIDSSALLLDCIRSHSDGVSVRVAVDDMLAFPKYLTEKVHVVLSMGDTLTHLQELAEVQRLFSLIAHSLVPGGKFVAVFRDYTMPLVGVGRFIPVRSDEDRIHTCFLEYASDRVIVHDILHVRSGSTWKQRVSSYQKLRLSPDWVVAELLACGFAVRSEHAMAGMVRIVASL
jgi:SAM-dependent methyltransferase